MKLFRKKGQIKILNVLIAIAVIAAIIVFIWYISQRITPPGEEVAKNISSGLRGALS